MTFAIQEPSGARTVVTQDDTINIGKTPSAEIKLTDPAVSRSHAMIENVAAGAMLTDLGSGTKVNGSTITRVALKSGDVIEVGQTKITTTFE